MLDKNKVVVGMSGGVDSTVAAYLLKEQGYDVIGVTMKLWQDDDEEFIVNYGGCCGLSAIDDARRVADALDIPFYVVNFKLPFREKVVDYFVNAYYLGETPNPCVMCNKYIKFDKLIQKAHQLGAYYIATGHYAKIKYEPDRACHRLFKAAETYKDQSYMLASLQQHQLKHILFPLANYRSKEDVRKIADSLDAVVARKSDSQEICFIADGDYATFISQMTGRSAEPGDFVDTTGRVLGKHRGIIHYTVGQRKGLGMTFGKAMYVVALDAATNRVVLGSASQVFSKGLIARQVSLVCPADYSQPTEVSVRIRHTQRDSAATLQKIGGDRYRILFKQAERAVTPGQAIAIYRDNEVIAGGFIDSALQ